MSSASSALTPEANALAKQTLAELSTQFDVVRSEIPIRGKLVTIHHPRNADDLIDEDAFAEDERLPYWADIWPSARVLAERIAGEPVNDRRYLELGCGAGLVAVAAAIAGFDITATDYYDDALRL